MPDAREGIALIHAAGGCSSVAHPALSGLVERDLRALAAAGLDGVEVDHPGQTPDVRKNLVPTPDPLASGRRRDPITMRTTQVECVSEKNAWKLPNLLDMRPGPPGRTP